MTDTERLDYLIKTGRWVGGCPSLGGYGLCEADGSCGPSWLIYDVPSQPTPRRAIDCTMLVDPECRVTEVTDENGWRWRYDAETKCWHVTHPRAHERIGELHGKGDQ